MNSGEKNLISWGDRWEAEDWAVWFICLKMSWILPNMTLRNIAKTLHLTLSSRLNKALTYEHKRFRPSSLNRLFLTACVILSFNRSIHYTRCIPIGWLPCLFCTCSAPPCRRADITQLRNFTSQRKTGGDECLTATRTDCSETKEYICSIHSPTISDSLTVSLLLWPLP